jgi:SHS2 domain-containing protein
MMKYKFIDSITSDVMFEAYGKDLRELFENSAEALFSVICKIDKIKPVKKEKFQMKAENVKDLMINWLQGLIAAAEVEEMFFCKFKVLEIDEEHVIGEVSGEGISPEKGSTVVKAVTYHKFSLEKGKKGYVVSVTLDI